MWDVFFTSLKIQLIELKNICKKNGKLENPINVDKIKYDCNIKKDKVAIKRKSLDHWKIDGKF